MWTVLAGSHILKSLQEPIDGQQPHQKLVSAGIENWWTSLYPVYVHLSSDEHQFLSAFPPRYFSLSQSSRLFLTNLIG